MLNLEYMRIMRNIENSLQRISTKEEEESYPRGALSVCQLGLYILIENFWIHELYL